MKGFAVNGKSGLPKKHHNNMCISCCSNVFWSALRKTLMLNMKKKNF